uniref:Uncharacterized protein n=1 Tax=Rhizophora mucronata TaxID=61149 RepID=A0A2P2PGI0_RHIMU
MGYLSFLLLMLFSVVLFHFS